MVTDERLLTVRETAKETGFSEASIRRWIREGLLDVERVGPTRRLRVRLTVVRRFFPEINPAQL